MIKFLKSIKAKARTAERAKSPVDIQRWECVFKSNESIVVEFSCLDCFTYDTLELVLKSPSSTVVASEDNPGFNELLDLCGAAWPRFWDDYRELSTTAFSKRQFVYVRSQGNEGFEYVAYEP